MKKLFLLFLLVSISAYSMNSFADESTVLHPIKWKGAQWEYLVEYPSEVRHIDPIRFEEILDTAGQHGWELVTVSHAESFYAFYFKRPLRHEKLKSIRARLTKVKGMRAAKENDIQSKIDAAYQKQLGAIQKRNQAVKN